MYRQLYRIFSKTQVTANSGNWQYIRKLACSYLFVVCSYLFVIINSVHILFPENFTSILYTASETEQLNNIVRRTNYGKNVDSFPSHLVPKASLILTHRLSATCQQKLHRYGASTLHGVPVHFPFFAGAKWYRF